MWTPLLVLPTPCVSAAWGEGLGRSTLAALYALCSGCVNEKKLWVGLLCGSGMRSADREDWDLRAAAKLVLKIFNRRERREQREGRVILLFSVRQEEVRMGKGWSWSRSRSGFRGQAATRRARKDDIRAPFDGLRAGHSTALRAGHVFFPRSLDSHSYLLLPPDGPPMHRAVGGRATTEWAMSWTHGAEVVLLAGVYFARLTGCG